MVDRKRARTRDTGPFADLIARQFEKATYLLGLDSKLAPLRTNLFHRLGALRP